MRVNDRCTKRKTGLFAFKVNIRFDTFEQVS